jgi:PERQ amino acid-rich with GYF domain-containing protein
MGQVRRLFFSSRTTGNIYTTIVDQPALTVPRKHSLSSTQGSLGAPRDASLPSARTRGSLTPGFDGILNSGETWTSRRRASESGTRLNSGIPLRGDGDGEPQSASRLKIDEEEEEHHRHSGSTPDPVGQDASSQNLGHPPGDSPQGVEPSINNDVPLSSVNGNESPTSCAFHSATQPVPADVVTVQSSPNSAPMTTAPLPVANPASIEWSYLDPQGQVQGMTQTSRPPGAELITSLQARSRLSLCRSGTRRAILP